MTVELEDYPMAEPQFAMWEVNITDVSGCPAEAEYYYMANAMDFLLIADNVPGKTYSVPLPTLEWSPRPCFSRMNVRAG